MQKIIVSLIVLMTSLSSFASTLAWTTDETLGVDQGSRPLDPKEYFPLGGGIRKNSKTVLIPYCVAVVDTSRACTHIQYFEIRRGEASDADRVVDTSFGAPENTVVNNESAFHGDPIGKPLTGYFFSNSVFPETAKKYAAGLRLPSEGDGKAAYTRWIEGAAGAYHMWALLPNLLHIGIATHGFDSDYPMSATRRNWFFGTTLAVHAAPYIVAGAYSYVYKPLKRKFAKKSHEKKGERIVQALIVSKNTGENWAFLKGKRVSAKAYDDFVEFLTQLSIANSAQ